MIRWVALFSFLIANVAMAAPGSYKKITANKNKKIFNCAVDGTSATLRATLQSKKISITLPKSYEVTSKTFGAKKSKYAACGTSDVDSSKTVLFIKKGVASTPTEHEINVADFPEKGDIDAACGQVKSWPGNFIYKTVGSSHFSSGDPRRSTIGFIVAHGAEPSGAIPSCMSILATNGEKIGQFGVYAYGGEYRARLYSASGCGTPLTKSQVASKAKAQVSGDDDIYIKIGSTCYGPIDSDSCRNSRDPQC